MKKTLLIFSVFLIALMTNGCDIWPFYTVSAAEEGVITQYGKITGGPKQPGLHFKTPIIQKAHKVNVHKIRFLPIPMDKNKTFEIQILWHVKDSIMFLKTSGLTSDDDKIETIITPIFKEIIDTYISETFIGKPQIQNKNFKLSNSDCERIMNLLTKSSIEFGLHIDDVRYIDK